METAAEPGIRLDERGVAWIAGTRTKVLEIVGAQQANGWTVAELHEELPHISVPQIELALAYYAAHREEVDTEMERRRQWAEEIRKTQPEGPSREELLRRLNRTS